VSPYRCRIVIWSESFFYFISFLIELILLPYYYLKIVVRIILHD
jgi:hypothetical protein